MQPTTSFARETRAAPRVACLSSQFKSFFVTNAAPAMRSPFTAFWIAIAASTPSRNSLTHANGDATSFAHGAKRLTRSSARRAALSITPVALADEVKLLALTLDERALMLNALEDPLDELAELRAVLLADHQWRRSEGID